MKQYLYPIILTIWLAFLTWNTWPRSVIRLHEELAISQDSLIVAQNRALRYARELRMVQEQDRIIAISPYLPKDSTFAQMEEDSMGSE